MTGLTDEEIRAVLAVAMGYDNRRPGALNVAAWREASDRGRWTLGEAINAVHDHYATTTDFLMPAHITERLRAQRRHEPRPGELQIPQAPPAQPERIRAAVNAIARNLGWPQRTTSTQDPELAIRCPYCHAAPQRPCGRHIGHGRHQGETRRLHGYHPSRTEAAKIRQEKP